MEDQPTSDNKRPRSTSFKDGFKGRKKKGYDAERELVALLRAKGWKAIRIPVSAPSGEPLPDVMATRDDTILAFEVKVSRKGYARFPRNQMRKLHLFLEMFQPFGDRIAIVAAKFPYKGWVIQRADEERSYTLHLGDPSMSLDSNKNTLNRTSKNKKKMYKDMSERD